MVVRGTNTYEQYAENEENVIPERGRSREVHRQTIRNVTFTKIRTDLIHPVTREVIGKDIHWQPPLSEHGVSQRELRPHGTTVSSGTDTIVFCEGEGATDTVQALMGSNTLTALGLHGQVIPEDKVLTQMLYDVSVFIFWPDHDSAGESVMERLSELLVEILPDAKQGWVTIPKHAKPKDDAVDLASDAIELVTAAIESAQPTRRKTVEVVMAEEYQEQWPDDVAPEHFYGVLGRITNKLCQYSEADPHALYMTLATSLPLFLGLHPNVPSPYNATTRFYSLVVGRAGVGRKGTSWKLVEQQVLKPLALMLGVEQELEEALCSNISSGEGIPYRFRDPDAPRNQLFYCEEFSSVFTSMSREGSKTSDYIKTGYDGGTLHVPNSTNPITAHNCHFAIIGHITPKQLRDSTKTIYSSNGFLRRWSFIASRKAQQFDGYLPTGLIDMELEDLAECVTAAKRCQRVLMDDEAMELMSGYKRQYEPKNDSFMAEVKSEATTPMLRLALILAMLDRKNHPKVLQGIVDIGHATPDGLRNDEELIKAVHLKAAHAWTVRSHETIQMVYGDREFSRNARKLLDVLEQSEKGELTQTEVQRKVFSGNLTSDDLRPVFRELLEADRIVKQLQHGDKGPATTIWRLKRGTDAR